MDDHLRNLLEQRKQTQVTPSPSAATAPSSKTSPGSTVECFGIQAPQGFSEHFADYRFKNGNRVAFTYGELIFLNYDAADSRLDLRYRGYLVTLFGENLNGELYDAFMDCRVRWVKEVDESQGASAGNVARVTRIEIIADDETQEDPEENGGNEA